MDFEIHLYSSPTNYCKFTLRVVQSHPRIRLEYILPNKQVFMSDFLDFFNTVKMDDTDEQVLSLIGPITRRIKFMTSSGFSNFCTYLKQVFDMKASADNFQLLSLRPKNSISPLQSAIPKQRRLNFDSVKLASFPTVGECEFADDFTNDFIWQKPVKISLSEAQILQPGNVLKSVVPFSALDPEPKAILSLWEKVLLNNKSKEDILDNYMKVKSQWYSKITSFTWKKNSSLRRYVQKLEFFIEKECEFKTQTMKEIMFDVAMTLFAFTYSKAEMAKPIFHLMEMFVGLLIIGTNNITKENEKVPNTKESKQGIQVFMMNGEILTYDAACSRVFALFASFYSQFLSNFEENDILPRQQDIILSCETFTRKFLPSSAFLFDIYPIETLQSCADIFYNFLIEFKSKDECRLLISSFLTSSKPSIFMRCIICAALKQFTIYAEHHNIHLNRSSSQTNQQINSNTSQQNLSGESQDLSQDSTSSSSQQSNHSQQGNSIHLIPFEPIFNAFLKQVNIRLLLHNEELLQSFTAPYIKSAP